MDPVNAAILEQNIAKLESVILKDEPFDHSAYPHAEPLRRSFSDLREHPAHQWGVLIPIYRDDDRYEANALAAWEAAMPTWQHIPVDATRLITWAGAIHCILMEVGWRACTSSVNTGEDLLRLQLFSAHHASLSSEPTPS